MKIETINEIMNCNCLQKIIENDKVKHTFSKDEHGIKTIQIAESAHIIFECVTYFRIKKNSIKNDSLVNKNDEEQCGIPLFIVHYVVLKQKIIYLKGVFIHNLIKNMKNKYRIFDKIQKEYCEEPDYRWLLSRNGKLYNSENDEWYTVGERFIIEFSTDVYDINNIELFEGDVCEVKEWCPYDYIENGFVGIVMYADGNFFICNDNEKNEYYQKIDECSVKNRSIIKIGDRISTDC